MPIPNIATASVSNAIRTPMLPLEPSTIATNAAVTDSTTIRPRYTLT